MHSVADTLNKTAAYVDSKVPFLAKIDAAVGLNPQARLDEQAAAEPAYQQKYGNSLAAGAGNFLGQAAATAPFLATGVGALGTAGGALAEGVGAAAPWLGRGVQAATDLATGTASAPGAGFAGNALARGAGLGVTGALQGAAFSGLTGGDPISGATSGAVLGPVVGTGVGAAKLGGALVGKIASKGYNALTGANITSEIENALAPGRAVAVAPTASPAPVPAEPIPSAAPPVEPAAAPPVAAEPAPSPGVPAGPGPTSPPPTEAAPAPTVATAQTPAQIAAAKTAAEVARLTQPRTQGFDDKVYVPGVNPTEAELAGHANTSVAQTQIASRNPQPFESQQEANTQKRVEHFNDLGGDASSLEALDSARGAQANQNLTAAWSNKQPTDAQPVMDQVQASLAGPDGKLAPVRNALQEVASSLKTADGSGLENDPEMLYGVRKQISFMLSSKGRAANPAYGDSSVVSQLRNVQTALDGVIEQGAPGYTKYLQDYATASKPIDTQELLQSVAPRLTAPGGMTLNNVQNFLKQVVTQRAAPGVNKAKSIDDATLEGLFNLRDDLARKSNIDLGKARGSPTNQNEAFSDALGLGAAQLATSHVPFANALIGQQLSSVKGKALDAWTNRLLNPPPNPLAGSPPPP